MGVATAAADVPNTVSLQGRLTTAAGLAAPDGNYDVLFSLWTAQKDGQKLWEETHSDKAAISTQNGVFNAVLGNISPIANSGALASKELWIQTQVVDHPPLPRVRLVSVPFAWQAQQIRCTDCVTAAEVDMANLSKALDGEGFGFFHHHTP